MITPGSIVVVTKLPTIPPKVQEHILWVPEDNEKTPYQIREVFKFEGLTWVLFHEGIIGYHKSGK